MFEVNNRAPGLPLLRRAQDVDTDLPLSKPLSSSALEKGRDGKPTSRCPPLPYNDPEENLPAPEREGERTPVETKRIPIEKTERTPLLPTPTCDEEECDGDPSQVVPSGAKRSPRPTCSSPKPHSRERKMGVCHRVTPIKQNDTVPDIVVDDHDVLVAKTVARQICERRGMSPLKVDVGIPRERRRNPAGDRMSTTFSVNNFIEAFRVEGETSFIDLNAHFRVPPCGSEIEYGFTLSSSSYNPHTLPTSSSFINHIFLCVCVANLAFEL